MFYQLYTTSSSAHFPFSALTQFIRRQEGHPVCKKLGVGLLVVTIWLELCTSYSCNCHHHFLHPSSNKIHSEDILVPANPGPPGKWLLMTVQSEIPAPCQTSNLLWLLSHLFTWLFSRLHQQLRSVTVPLNRFYVLWRHRNYRRIIIIIIIKAETECISVLTPC